MRSGDRPGLQNRRVVGNPVTGGFDPHSLPPLFLDNSESSSGTKQRRAKDHVSRVVDDNVETAVFLDDSFDGLVG